MTRFSAPLRLFDPLNCWIQVESLPRLGTRDLTLGYEESGLGLGSLACGSSSSLKWESQYPNFSNLFLFPRWEMGWVIRVIVDDVPVRSSQSHVAFGWIRTSC